MRQLRHNKDVITVVGRVCALPVKLAATQETLDREHYDLERTRHLVELDSTTLVRLRRAGLCEPRLLLNVLRE
jgi:hypothetical protein